MKQPPHFSVGVLGPGVATDDGKAGGSNSLRVAFAHNGNGFEQCVYALEGFDAASKENGFVTAINPHALLGSAAGDGIKAV